MEKILGIVVYTLIVIYVTVMLVDKKPHKIEVVEVVDNKEVIEPNILLQAMIIKESKGDAEAIGSKDDVGVLQITPIMLDEANRIIGYNRWTLSDRFSRDASIEIWITIMESKNPEYDLHKACKIWNPRAGIYYHNEVERIYKQLLEYEKETITKGNS